MKKINFVCRIVLACFTVSVLSCSSDVDELNPTENETSISQELVLTFDEKDFQSNLDNVSALFKLQTRANGLDEEKAKEVIAPFVEEGYCIKSQLLDDASISQEERDYIDNLNDEELAVLSIIAYSIVEAVDEENETNGTYNVNNRLHCIGVALVGGGSVTGGLTWGLITRVGTRTAVRMATSALGGMVGGAITAAMYINDYNNCMKYYCMK